MKTRSDTRRSSLSTAAAGGVLLGAVPVAWAVVRWRHGLDLAAAGSSNVGANNALRTTGSKGTGAAVLVLDALKGAAAVHLGRAAAGAGADEGAQFVHGSAALLGAVAGHNYNPILSLARGRLVGGKGLATAAGGLSLLMPRVVVAWAALFLAGREGWKGWRGVRDTIAGNVVATLLVPVAARALYGRREALVTALFAPLVLPKHAQQAAALWRGEPTDGGPSETDGETGPAQG